MVFRPPAGPLHLPSGCVCSLSLRRLPKLLSVVLQSPGVSTPSFLSTPHAAPLLSLPCEELVSLSQRCGGENHFCWGWTTPPRVVLFQGPPPQTVENISPPLSRGLIPGTLINGGLMCCPYYGRCPRFLRGTRKPFFPLSLDPYQGVNLRRLTKRALKLGPRSKTPAAPFGLLNPPAQRAGKLKFPPYTARFFKEAKCGFFLNPYQA